jgi:hypothetical protein
MNNLVTVCWKCHRDIHDGRLTVKVIERSVLDVTVEFWRVV